MTKVKNILKYAENTGGIFSYDDIEAIPYNHWKKDFEWLVLILEHPKFCTFVPVQALTAREACTIAITQYKLMEEYED